MFISEGGLKVLSPFEARQALGGTCSAVPGDLCRGCPEKALQVQGPKVGTLLGVRDGVIQRENILGAPRHTLLRVESFLPGLPGAPHTFWPSL